jgi:serine/threonine protein kinase
MLVMPLVTCGDLGRFCTGTRLPPARARFYFAELCTVLRYLHRQRFIYRDLKPENVLLCANGHVLLCDMGCVAVPREGTARSGPVRTLTLAGTIEYMAPEMAVLFGRAANPEPYSCAVDWWSLGVLAHRVLTGSYPFRGGAGMQALQSSSVKAVLEAVKGDTGAFYGHFYGTVSLQLGDVMWGGDDPGILAAAAEDLLRGLLSVDPAARLQLDYGFAESSDSPSPISLAAHPYFAGVEWDAVESRQVPVPYLPTAEDVVIDVHSDVQSESLNTTLRTVGTEDLVSKSPRADILAQTMQTSLLSDPQQLVFMDWNHTNPSPS